MDCRECKSEGSRSVFLLAALAAGCLLSSLFGCAPKPKDYSREIRMLQLEQKVLEGRLDQALERRGKE